MLKIMSERVRSARAASDSRQNAGERMKNGIVSVIARARAASRSRVTSQQIAAAGWPPRSRAKDITYHPFFRGAISRWLWRFFTWRLTPPCRWFLILTMLWMTFGSNSLDLQIYVPFTYALGVWIVAVACVLLFRPRVTLHVRHVDRVQAGDILPIDIDVTQNRRMTGAIQTLIPHKLPPSLDAVPEDGTRVPPLTRGQKTRIRTGVLCARRGLHAWQGFRVECDFPFGLIRAYRIFPNRHTVLVYPTFTPLARLTLPLSLRYQPGGIVFASTTAESLEYIGNREYREGDNIRDIDWRATARLNLPIVREFREEYFLRAGVVLDTHVPPAPYGVWVRPRDRQAQEDNFERAVSLAASVSDYMARHDYIVDLLGAGPDLHQLSAGRNLAYLDQILEILARIAPVGDEPFDTLEPQLAAYIAQITTLVCIFLDWNETRRAFVQRLAREGAGIKVIIARDLPCTLDPQLSDLVGGITVISEADYRNGIEEI